jgi:hypothetical protein
MAFYFSKCGRDYGAAVLWIRSGMADLDTGSRSYFSGRSGSSSRIHRLGDKVNSGIGLSYPGYMVGGPERQPYAGVDFIPHTVRDL